jgi:hypothetical protein
MLRKPFLSSLFSALRLSDRTIIRLAHAIHYFKSLWLSSRLHSLSTFIIGSPNTLRRKLSVYLVVTFLSLIVYVFTIVHDRFVILPFEAFGNKDITAAVGNSFAQSIAAYLDDLRVMYHPRDFDNASPQPIDPDALDNFISNLPTLTMPSASFVGKTAVSLTPLKIGNLSIPITEFVFEYLPIFHRNTLRGSIEKWDESVTVRLKMPGFATLSFTYPANTSVAILQSRAVIEVLRRKGWLSLPTIDPSSFDSFKQAFSAYTEYKLSGNLHSLNLALSKYQDALRHDRNAELIRLHLSALEYNSWDPSVLIDAIENFATLKGSNQFRTIARLGYVAAQLRYVSRIHGDCGILYSSLNRMLLEVSHWANDSGSNSPPSDFREAVLYGRTYAIAATYLDQDNPCAGTAGKGLAAEDAPQFIRKAEEAYTSALNKLGSQQASILNALTSIQRLILQVDLTYLLNEKVKYEEHNGDTASAISVESESIKIAEAALKDREHLPDRNKLVLFPFIRGSIAESYLRLAHLSGTQGERAKWLESAVSLLTDAVNEESERVAQWASLRLAEIHFSREDFAKSFEMINAATKYHNISTETFTELALRGTYSVGVFIESPEFRCRAIDTFKKLLAIDERNVLLHIYLAEAYRRNGNRELSAATLGKARSIIAGSGLWYGPAILESAAAAEAKLGSKGNPRSTARNATPTVVDLPLQKLVNEYELALLNHDVHRLKIVNEAIPSRVGFALVNGLIPTGVHSQGCGRN